MFSAGLLKYKVRLLTTKTEETEDSRETRMEKSEKQ